MSYDVPCMKENLIVLKWMRHKYMIFASLFHIDYGIEQFSVEWLDNCASVNDIENKMAEN